MNAELTTARVGFLKDALYAHANQIRDYFRSSRSRIASYEGKHRQQHLIEFVSRAGLLVSQLDTLIRSARKVRLLATSTNLEQLEALVHHLYREVQHLSREALGDNPELRELSDVFDSHAFTQASDSDHEAA